MEIDADLDIVRTGTNKGLPAERSVGLPIPLLRSKAVAYDVSQRPMALDTRITIAGVHPPRPRMSNPNAATKSAVPLRQDTLEDTATKVMARTKGQLMIAGLSPDIFTAGVINPATTTNASDMSP